jgi:hypothetical protein
MSTKKKAGHVFVPAKTSFISEICGLDYTRLARTTTTILPREVQSATSRQAKPVRLDVSLVSAISPSPRLAGQKNARRLLPAGTGQYSVQEVLM